jgi:serine/threonine protein kinase
MITGRLPFPDAKGPAGLITAQLKQTPVPPSQAHPRAKATLSKAADRAILKCLEKDKNNRFPDVSALAVALQEVMSTPDGDDMDLLETRRSDAPSIPPTPSPGGQGYAGLQRAAAPAERAPQMTAHAGAPASLPPSLLHKPQAIAPPLASQMFAPRPPTAQPSPYVQVPSPESANALRHGGGSLQVPLSVGTYPPQTPHAPLRGARSRSSKKLVWWVIVLLAVGAGVGTALALLLSK